MTDAGLQRGPEVCFRERPVVAFTLTGELASKSNQRRLMTIRTPPRLDRHGRIRTTRPLFVKSAKAVEIADDMAKQVLRARRGAPPIKGPVSLRAVIVYGSNRPDLDESLLMDILQQGGLIANDRQIVHKEITKGVDPARPRIDVVVREVAWDRQKGLIA